MPILNKQGLLKPYNIVMDDTGKTAEINLYGEVVETRPIDFWTGQPIPGNFIMQDEFLQDLDKLAACESVTVHINSVGGSLYVGAAIYNRLKGLAAKVTTINDGLAASAGSLIFMAGDTRKMHSGSNLMIHEAAGFLYGYYKRSDLKQIDKQLAAHDKVGINIYVECTGKSADEVKAMITRETWLTGQEAVEAGFADEVITSEENPVQMRLSPDRATMMVNGYPVAARCLGNIPETVAVMTAEEWAEVSTPASGVQPPQNSANPAQQVSNNTIQNGGNAQMEIRNEADLRKAFPDLVAQIETAAQATGAAAERQRIQGIESIANAIGDAEMIRNAKFGEKPMNAQELAFAAMQKHAAIGAQMVGKMAADAAASGAANVTGTPAGDPAGEDPNAQADNIVNLYKSMKK